MPTRSPGQLYLHLRRALAYHIELQLARLRWKTLNFDDSPIVIGNAMAKSGSKLLRQIFQGFQYIGPFAPLKPWPIRMITQQGRVRDREEIRQDLDELRPGDLALGYVHAEQIYIESMTQPDWATFFLVRDPRDVLVSHVYYATEMYPEHSLNELYSSLDDFDARLTVEISGTEGYPYLPDVRQRYEYFIGFLDRSDIMLIRFEELRADPEGTIANMIDHIRARSAVDILPTEQALPLVLDEIDPSKSSTFRSGVPGAWKDHFKEHHKQHFREIAGDLLQILGYEESDEW